MNFMFTIPTKKIILLGQSEEDFNKRIAFIHQRLQCELSYDKTDLYPFNSPVMQGGYTSNLFMFIDNLNIRVNDSINKLQKCLINNDLESLGIFIVGIYNRCARAIRNFGLVININEYCIHEDERFVRILDDWQGQFYDETNGWKTITGNEGKKPNKLDFCRNFSSNIDGELYLNKWQDVENAIINDLSIPPEKEFLVNSLEQLKFKNLRSSLLESVIGLEIVLSNYLMVYLTICRKLDSKIVKEFLRPHLELRDRITVMLDLTFYKGFLDRIDLNKVKLVIKWRNEIMHNGGHLPPSISETDITNNILEVLNLVYYLGIETKYIKDNGHARSPFPLARTLDDIIRQSE
jgi:hypothetical protein